MATTPFKRVTSREIYGADISGIQDAVNKMETVLDMHTAVATNHALLAVSDQSEPAQHRRLYEGTLRKRAQLIREQLAQRPELLQHRIGPTPPTAGVVVNIQSMQVRRQDDIDGISRQLHRRIQSSTRAKGGRY